jgi:hypothetical protein
VASTALMGGAALSAATAGTASASTTPLVTATTRIVNNPDSGGNGNWAYDNLTRTLTVSVAPSATSCAHVSGYSAASGDICYMAAISDTGVARTILGAYAPNQGTGTQNGTRIVRSESVPFTGSATYKFYAPKGDTPAASNVAKYVNNDYSTSGPAYDSTPSWYLQAFASGDRTNVPQNGIDNDWSWKYTDACGSWTDAANNNAGQSTPTSTDGNITGATCVVGTTAVGMIKNPASQKCLDVTAGDFAVGGKLQEWACGAEYKGVAGADQQFEIVNYSNKTAELVAVSPSGSKFYVTTSGDDGQLVLASHSSAGSDLSKQGPFYVFPKVDLAMNATGSGNGSEVVGSEPDGSTAQQWSMP